jgi:hypothetical protein
MVVCTACNKRFSHSGYTFHGQRTEDLRCRNAYLAVIAQRLADEMEGFGDQLSDNDNHGSPSEDSDDLSPANDSDAPDIPENNSDHGSLPDDFYADLPASPDGAFRAQDLDPSSQSDTDSDMDSDRSVYAQDEEELPSNIPIGFVPQEPQDINHGDALPEVQANPDTIHIERFTRGHAGAPVNINELPSHQQYQQPFFDPENPYAPFTSQIDWKFAHWAKTCGISSTSLTELLSIEGVSHIVIRKS